MPPFMLLSLVGPAIALHNNETLQRRSRTGSTSRPRCGASVAAASPATTPPDGTIDPEVEALLERPAEPVVLTEEQVRDRALTGLAEEARLMLDEGVVAGPEDLDLAMITGAGFSFWNGGLTMLLDPGAEGQRQAFH